MCRTFSLSLVVGGRSTCGRELMASKKEVVPAPEATDPYVVRFYVLRRVNLSTHLQTGGGE